MIARALVASIATLVGGATQACEVPILEGARQLNGPGSSLVWRFVPAEPKIGEFFALEFGGCAQGAPFAAETMRIDATMPAHRHGMNFRPTIVAIGPGLYRAEGMMFHMPGTWQLSFEQRSAAGATRLTSDIVVE